MTIDEAAKYYARHLQNKEIAEFSFVVGVNSPTAKEYWQQGMYTELEVLSLLTRWAPPEEINQLLMWFEENKKK